VKRVWTAIKSFGQLDWLAIDKRVRPSVFLIIITVISDAVIINNTIQASRTHACWRVQPADDDRNQWARDVSLVTAFFRHYAFTFTTVHNCTAVVEVCTISSRVVWRGCCILLETGKVLVLWLCNYACKNTVVIIVVVKACNDIIKPGQKAADLKQLSRETHTRLSSAKLLRAGMRRFPYCYTTSCVQ